MKKLLLLSLMLFAVAGHAVAADLPVYRIAIKDHRFQPDTLEIPADRKVKLLIANQDATPEEFDSYELNREKIVPGNTEVPIFIGPLKPGEYKFVGEFHEDTAQGKVIVTRE